MKLILENMYASTLEEDNMIGWIVTFFMLAVATGLLGFSGLAGTLIQIAQYLTVILVVLFAAGIFYSVIVGYRPRVPPLP